MGYLVTGDDGLPAEDVGQWAKQKHDYLCRYIDISRGVRAKFVGYGQAGATFVDLFCGPGRAKVRETGEWVDGGVVAAWKKSVEGGAPFTRVIIGDLDEERRDAARARLEALNAPVVEVSGSAIEAIQAAIPLLNPHALHFAFLDPFNLEALDFGIIAALAGLKRIDMLVHVNQMDLQRNLVSNATSEESAFDIFAPGWRDKVDIVRSPHVIRQHVFEFWRDQVAGLGVWPSAEMKLITGSRNQPLYWLLLAAKHDLAHRFWKTASDMDNQGKLDF